MYEKACFSKKIFTNNLNTSLPPWTYVGKTIHGVETHWFSGKEKVPGAAISKEDNPNSLENGRTVNSDFY